MKKKIVAIMMALTMIAGGVITSYAAEESVSYTWVQGIDGVLKVADSNNNIVTNTWYKDTDGSYYYLGQDGSKQTGLLLKNGNYYYLDAEGKVVVTDGVYEGINLTFNKDKNDANYGVILSGAQDLMFAGVHLVNADGAPEIPSVTDTTTTTMAQSQVENQNIENQIGSENYDPYGESSKLYTSCWNDKHGTQDSESYNRAFTQEELMRMKEALDEIR